VLKLIIATLVFYALHSLLAWTGVKEWSARSLGLKRWYRLVYSVISVILVCWVWMAYRGAGREGDLYATTDLMHVAGWLLVVFGSVLSGAAILRFGGAGFLGLTPERATGLVRSGLHGYMRHPIYSGLILMACGWLMLSGSWATVVVVGLTFIYLPIGMHLEERKLVAEFGDDYVRYRRDIPAILPRLRTEWPR
jgi:protein-S-isoprenylcysteine O-methyltransferase Ste14